MAKFNVRDTRVGARTAAGPLTAEARPSGLTHEGGPGYEHTDRSALFLLAVANFVGERTFYESTERRDDRYRDLVRRNALDDPLWTAHFLDWLRSEGNMRSASLVGALEFVKARLDVDAERRAQGSPGPSVLTYELNGVSDDREIDRWVVDRVLQRADEPGEALAYWTSRYGRAIPKPVKRGVADAVQRLYTERNLLKYDTGSRGFRFGDVIELTHPRPHPDRVTWQGDLFRYALDRRHNRPNITVPDALAMIRANVTLRMFVASGGYDHLLSSERLAAAGMTWEDALSLAGGRPTEVSRARLWEALVPSMGYMALLRNLRNFDEAGVSDEIAQRVAARLADPDEVKRSRQFPYRFLAAFNELSSLRWGPALETALNCAVTNVPELAGRSLVLVDTSASMNNVGLSERSKMTPAQVAALFGVTLAVRNPGRVDLVGFADGVFRHPVRRGAAVLSEARRFTARTGEVGHGTRIHESVRATYDGHDRVFIISDMQTFADSGRFFAGHHGDRPGPDRDGVPNHVPIYGFNLGGYQHTALPFGAVPNRTELGGLTDATFRMVPLLEAGQSANWPWEDRA